METEEKKYIVNIESNIDKYAKDAQDADKAVDDFIAANAELLATQDKTNKEYVKAAATLKVLQTERANANKSVQTAIKASRAEEGSYEKLLRQWQLAQVELKNLKKTYDVSASGVYTLSQKYIDNKKAVEDAKRSLDAFGKGVADNRLNVGNYSEAIQGALGGLQSMPGPLGAAASGVKNMSAAFKVLLANPIVLVITLIVGAVTALINIFKKFDPIIDRIQKIMSGLNAVFKAFKDTTIGLITGQQSLKESFDGLGQSMRDAYNEGVRLKELQQELDDMNWLLIESEAKKKRQIDELILQSKDRTKSEKERTALIDEALKVEKELYKERKAVADRERLIAENTIIAGRNLTSEQVKQLRQVGVAYAIKLKDIKDVSDEEVQALAESIAKQEQVLNESVNIREKAINRQNALIEKAETERERAAEKAKEKELARIKALAEAAKKAAEDTFGKKSDFVDIENTKAEAIMASNEKIIANEQNSFDQRLKALQDNLQIRTTLLAVQSELEIAEIDKDEELKTISTERAASRRLAVQAKLSADSLKILEETGEKSRAILDAQVREQYDIERENAQIALENAQENYAERQAILDREYQDIKQSAQYIKMSELEKMRLDNEYTRSTKANSQARIAQKKAELNYIAGALGTMSQVVGETTAMGKAFAVAEAVINTWVAASKALVDPTIPSTIARIALMVSVIGSGLMTVKNILAVKVPGGGGGGGGASAGSTSLSASIPAQRMTASANKPTVLTQMSQQQLNAQANVPQLTKEDLVDALSTMPTPIVTVEDINAKIAADQKVKVRATI